MNAKSFLLLVASIAGLAQYACGQGKEIGLDYSFLAYNPAKSIAGTRYLNGGGGSVGMNYGDYITLKSEFNYSATSTFTYHLPQTANSAAGTYKSQGNMFTYLFGSQFNIPMERKRLFGEALFGGAYTDAYGNLFKAAKVTGLSASNSGFAMAFGGGLDIAVSKTFAVRPVQIDYFLTRYEWKPIGINNQSNFRYQAGVLFAFGHY